MVSLCFAKKTFRKTFPTRANLVLCSFKVRFFIVIPCVCSNCCTTFLYLSGGGIRLCVRYCSYYPYKYDGGILCTNVGWFCSVASAPAYTLKLQMYPDVASQSIQIPYSTISNQIYLFAKYL